MSFKVRSDHLNGNSLQVTDVFLSPSVGVVTIPMVLESIESFVNEDPGGFYRLVIGTDSQVKVNNGQEECEYVSAIVIYRWGRGARYFWRKVSEHKKPTLRDKIYTETLMSLDVAQKIGPKIPESMHRVKYELEIHIDVGQAGPTREMVKEVVGMVNGNGYAARIKPDSWGASSVADRHA